MTVQKFAPENDGVTHINVYSKGKTELGRFLSNFAYSPIETEDGPFNSIEGYWYWLSTGDEELRTLHGNAAKAYGRAIRGKDWVETPEFRAKIKMAITQKLRNNPERLRKFAESVLPLAHYYLMWGKVCTPKQGHWVIDHLTACRDVARMQLTSGREISL